MNVHDFLTWPEHHVGLAWWIAVTSVVWGPALWRIAKHLPLWGARWNRYELDLKIRAIETLHGDTNRLVLYLVRDLMAVALDFCWLCFGLAAMALYAKNVPLKINGLVTAIGVSMGSSVFGRAIRIRTVVRTLMYYDTEMGKLKAKQAKQLAKVNVHRLKA